MKVMNIIPQTEEQLGVNPDKSEQVGPGHQSQNMIKFDEFDEIIAIHYTNYKGQKMLRI